MDKFFDILTSITEIIFSHVNFHPLGALYNILFNLQHPRCLQNHICNVIQTLCIAKYHHFRPHAVYALFICIKRLQLVHETTQSSVIVSIINSLLFKTTASSLTSTRSCILNANRVLNQDVLKIYCLSTKILRY